MGIYQNLAKADSEMLPLEVALNKLTNIQHGVCTEAGWWDGVDKQDPNICAAKMCLIHSEVSEAMEGMRKDLMDDKLLDRKMEEAEMADVLLRVFDYAGARGLDLGGALVEKLRYNIDRKDHKLEERAKSGGKKI